MPEPSIIHKLVQDVKLSFAATPAPAAPMRDVGSPEEYQALPKIVPLGSTSKMLSKGQKNLLQLTEAQIHLAVLTKVACMATIYCMACKA